MAAVSCAMGENGYSDRSCRAGTPAPIPEGSKWGYITASGKRIRAKFDVYSYFFHGTASVCTGDRCGWIDEKGRFIAPPYPRNRDWRVSAYSDGLAAVQGKNGAGYIDKFGKVVVPFRYTYAGTFNHGIAWAGDGRGAFFIDRTGRRLTPPFQIVTAVYGGFVDVRFVGKSQVTCINMRGKQVSARKCVERDYSAGLRPVQIGGRWGYKDIRGEMVIPPQFERASDFAEGLAAVRIGEKEGFIDPHGKVVIAPQFAGTTPFCGGLSRVFVDPDPVVYFSNEFGNGQKQVDARWELIDRSGSVVWRDSIKRGWIPAQIN